MIDSITIEPPMRDWPALIKQQPRGEVFGRPLEKWRRIVRDEYNLIEDKPVVATGHQPTLWHPGILAKYIAAQAFGWGGRANVLDVTVAQDIVKPATLDIPFRRRADGMLGVRTIDLADSSESGAPSAEAPIVARPPFAIRSIEWRDGEQVPPFVREGLERIHGVFNDGARQPNAAAQMMVALWRLMTECAGLGMMDYSMSSSIGGKLGSAMLRAMADDPHRCASCYNAAVAAVPEARLTSLEIRDDLVELPLWRLHDDGRRLRAWNGDVEAALEEIAIPLRQRRMRLMPRALTMTAMLRLAVCDLFIHGSGGIVYDRAMERWIRDWLGVEVSPMALVTADARLPLMDEDDLALVRRGELELARSRQRMLQHDPEAGDGGAASPHRPGARKQSMLREIDRLPRRSAERRAAYSALHQQLQGMRGERAAAIVAAHADVERLESLPRDAEIALRRDWAFPLYPAETLSALVREIRARAIAGSLRDPG